MQLLLPPPPAMDHPASVDTILAKQYAGRVHVQLKTTPLLRCLSRLPLLLPLPLPLQVVLSPFHFPLCVYQYHNLFHPLRVPITTIEIEKQHSTQKRWRRKKEKPWHQNERRRAPTTTRAATRTRTTLKYHPVLPYRAKDCIGIQFLGL